MELKPGLEKWFWQLPGNGQAVARLLSEYGRNDVEHLLSNEQFRGIAANTPTVNLMDSKSKRRNNVFTERKE